MLQLVCFLLKLLLEKKNNNNYKGFVKKKISKEMISGDTRCPGAILDFLKSKRLEETKTVESLEGDEVIIAGLLDMPPLKGDEEKL